MNRSFRSNLSDSIAGMYLASLFHQTPLKTYVIFNATYVAHSLQHHCCFSNPPPFLLNKYMIYEYIGSALEKNKIYICQVFPYCELRHNVFDLVQLQNYLVHLINQTCTMYVHFPTSFQPFLNSTFLVRIKYNLTLEHAFKILLNMFEI